VCEADVDIGEGGVRKVSKLVVFDVDIKESVGNFIEDIYLHNAKEQIGLYDEAKKG
jgi:hypothetical protein